MNKTIRLLVESFFDDEIFNVENDIKSDLEDLARYYEYTVGDIFYQNDKPYAICCGEAKQFNDNKPRFCLLNSSIEELLWRTHDKLVNDLECFKFKDFDLNIFNDFKDIDEDGYKNTQIIKNNYKISEFPAFKECINLGDNVYLPAIDELQIMLLNKNKLGKYSLRIGDYWSSTQYSDTCVFFLSILETIMSATTISEINFVFAHFSTQNNYKK